jgi:hypothetical protein
MRKRVYDNAPSRSPRFLAGDPVVDADGTRGRVEYSRRDAQVCVVWDHSGKREWCHEDVLQLAPGFQPTGRR